MPQAKPKAATKRPDAKEAGLRSELRNLTEAVSRASITAYLGKSYDGKRKLYEALGYKLNPVYQDFFGHYRRTPMARAIIDRPVRACWRKRPALVEPEDQATDFGKAWKELVKERHVFSYFSRADRLASIGSYSVILLGLDDGGTLEQPVEKATKLLYLSTLSEQNAKISTYCMDRQNPRFGLPETYNCTFQIGTGQQSEIVHWTRIIHIAEDLLESDVEGQSRIEPILNRLEDLERIVGGSAEMYWRGAFPGYNFNIAADASVGTQDASDLNTEIEAYIHNLQRYVKTQGMDVKALTQQVADPRPAVEAIVDQIAAATAQPKRILLGSERGELASSQDSESWNAHIEERRQEHCETRIIRPFVCRLYDLGVIPEPSEYEIRWPELAIQGASDKATVGKLKTDSLVAYANSNGAEGIVPPEIYLREVLGFSEDLIDEIEEALVVQDAELAKEEEAAAKARAAEMKANPQAFAPRPLGGIRPVPGSPAYAVATPPQPTSKEGAPNGTL